MYTHNLKILLLDKNDNIVEDKPFLDMIKNKLCQVNTMKLFWKGKPMDISIKWDRKILTKLNEHFMGDLFSEPVYEQDSIIVKHTEEVISSLKIDNKYIIEFYISRTLRDTVPLI